MRIRRGLVASLVGVLALGLAAGARSGAPREAAEPVRTDPGAPLERARLEQALILAEPTAVMLGELEEALERIEREAERP